MILKRSFLLTLFLCYPTLLFAVDVNELANSIASKTTYEEASKAYEEAVKSVSAEYKEKGVAENVIEEQANQTKSNIETAKTGSTVPTDTNTNTNINTNSNNAKKDNRTAEQRQKDLNTKKKAYEDAKATEQSTANKTMTALTTAATGIGGMELAMGLSEKKADEAADKDMQAYIETFRCTYGGKQVKAGIEEIELPGGNDEKLMGLRAEYVALAADLKERKEALGMKPGIESEKIYDKAEMGLYDDENIGITGGAYESLYRAKALNSEEDQAKLDEQKKEAKNRMIAGGVLVGAGVLGGIIGNSAINGKLGEAIKKAKTDKNVGKETKKALKVEENALEDLQKCLKKAGFQNPDKLSFDNFFASALSTKNVSCKDITLVGDKKSSDINATDVIPDTTDESEIFDTMTSYLPMSVVGKMIGYTLKDDSGEEDQTKAKEVLKKSIATAKKNIEDAAKADEANKSSASEEGGGILSTIAGSGTLDSLKSAVTSKMGANADASGGGN